jgi:hypothetical protein
MCTVYIFINIKFFLCLTATRLGYVCWSVCNVSEVLIFVVKRGWVVSFLPESLK